MCRARVGLGVERSSHPKTEKPLGTAGETLEAAGILRKTKENGNRWYRNCHLISADYGTDQGTIIQQRSQEFDLAE